ncbi:MAG: hypothetical protein JW995_12125 [Melioribacteraceae bacterium]|nr:hypothetical protein [Melioribacteraceae bacterium]
MSDQEKYIDEFKKRLYEVVRKKWAVKLSIGVNVLIILTLSLNIFFSLFELLGAQSVNARSILFYSFVIITAAAGIKFILLPVVRMFGLFGKPDYIKTAENVGEHFTQIKDELVNAFQLYENRLDESYSKDLTNGAIKKIYLKSKGINFTESLNFSPVQKYLKITFTVIVLTVVVFALFPDMRGASFRVIYFDKEFSRPPEFAFELHPGNYKLTKGDDVVISAHTIGEQPESIELLTKSTDETVYQSNTLYPESTGVFFLHRKGVKNSFKYYAKSGSIESDKYSIEVINRPEISFLETIIEPPQYSGLPQIIQKDNGNITTLTGSRVSVKIKSSKEIKSAELLFGNNLTKPFLTDGFSGSAEFRVFNKSNYKIILNDTEGYKNSNPITYMITPITDEYPSIRLIEPGGDITLGKLNQVSLLTHISDDYGFTKLVLNYKISSTQFGQPETEYRKKIIAIENGNEQDVYFVWNLEELVPAVNDVVSYFLEIFDNDAVAGPKIGRTKIYNISVPSLDELFETAGTEQENAEENIVELIEETKELSEELERISDELKQDSRELTWEEKEQIESAVDKFEELSNKAKDIRKKLNETRKNLQENELLSQETLEKYIELQELMDELNSDDMSETMKRLQEMLQTLNRNQSQQAFEDMMFNEEMFKKSLERTLNLLKRIKIEQKVDELVKRTEEIVTSLERLSEETGQSDQADKNTMDELSEKQNSATKKIEKLEEEMSKLRENMVEFDDMPIQDLEKLIEEMKEQENTELSEIAEQNLKQQNKTQALQQQNNISQNMQSMMQQMQQLKEDLEMQSQVQTVLEMMNSINNLLDLSKEQENLKQSTENSSPSSQSFSSNAKDQAEIQRNLDRTIQQLVNLSQKTFAITPETGRALGQARSEMSNAITSIQNRSSSTAVQSQISSMQRLNEAASLMKAGVEQMMQGGQGGGMMSLMQQMQQMSERQMRLNQLTQQLNQEGQLSQEQRAELQRLAKEQEVIRKSLEQLNREAKESGESKTLAGNLDRILEEMKEAVVNMQTEKVNDNLIQAQERILSKLLDAQRSINERDFEKERESKSGKVITRESPPEIIFSTEEGKDVLRNELLKAIQEGYSKDYEELIRKYYEALQKKEY